MSIKWMRCERAWPTLELGDRGTTDLSLPRLQPRRARRVLDRRQRPFWPRKTWSLRVVEGGGRGGRGGKGKWTLFLNDKSLNTIPCTVGIRPKQVLILFLFHFCSISIPIFSAHSTKFCHVRNCARCPFIYLIISSYYIALLYPS